MATVVTVKRRPIGTIVTNNGIKMGAELYGIPWKSMEFHGILWKMGIPWKSKEFIGIPRNSTENWVFSMPLNSAMKLGFLKGNGDRELGFLGFP